VPNVVIDWGFPVLENFGLQMEDLEEQILDVASRDVVIPWKKFMSLSVN